MILLTALKNFFFRGPVFALVTCIPGLWDSMNCRLRCTINTFCVLCHPYDSLTQSLCLPSVSFQIHGTRRTISVESLWLRCPSFGISCFSQWWCCQFYWLFFILKALSKGKGQWNAWPQCNTLLWGVGCWVKWHLGQHCSMPRKEQKLFSLANLQSVKLPLASLLDSGGQCLYFILLRWFCLELGTGQVPHLTL